MNAKSTRVWLVIAATLFALVCLLQPFLRRSAAGPKPLLSALRPAEVAKVRVIFPDAPKICAERVNGVWQLTSPIHYPAQTAAIKALLGALRSLTPALQFNAGEFSPTSDAEYGFLHPLTLDLQQRSDRWQLLVGRRTAPGDQVYLRIAGVRTVFVVDAGWLKYIPASADDWRDTALVDMNVSTFDWIIITNGPQTVELRRDPASHLWRMTRPLEARADNESIADALRLLQTARITRFVMDDPNADLSTYGLQPAHLDLWLGRGTNAAAALFLGGDVTRTASQVFGQRKNWDAVFTTAAPPLSYWWAQVNSFRDPYLFELTAPVSEIQVRGPDDFTLRRSASNDWQVVGAKFPADAGSVRRFIQILARLRVTKFVKDVVTPPDFPLYGLAKPIRQITLFSTAGGTKTVIAQLTFGATRNNEVFVRRTGEDSVYAISRADFNRLPETGWEFRQRHIWDFSDDDVAQITIRQNGRTRKVVRIGLNQWSLAPGSEGIIVPPAIEETAYQLGHLYAAAWIAGDVTNAAPYGFRPGNLSLTVGLKNGANYVVDFGETVSSKTALAGVILDGERWVFVFPAAVYQLVQSYLTIPGAGGGFPDVSATFIPTQMPRHATVAAGQKCPPRSNSNHAGGRANKPACLSV
jgi:Domain of unknown function (DUF4340)